MLIWAVLQEYKNVFRRGGQGRRSGGVALYVKKWIDYKELSLRIGQEQFESLCVKIRDGTNEGQLVVGV